MKRFVVNQETWDDLKKALGYTEEQMAELFIKSEPVPPPKKPAN